MVWPLVAAAVAPAVVGMAGSAINKQQEGADTSKDAQTLDMLTNPENPLYNSVPFPPGSPQREGLIGQVKNRVNASSQGIINATPQPQYGGYEGGAQDMSNVGMQHMGMPDAGNKWAMGEMQRDRGPMAVENQELSDREAQSRGYDQAGAMQLHREAAMGMAPSEAAYMMQEGLDRGIANQSAMVGGARGGAALALAQGNAQANVANMQNQAFTEAGRLRAAEMAQARGAYGDMSNQVRNQDQARLGQGNQMSQFNAGLNDQYRLGMGGLANQFGAQSQGWYRGAQAPLESQLGAETSNNATRAGMANNQNTVAAQAKHWQDIQDNANVDRVVNTVGTGMQVAGGIAAANANKPQVPQQPNPDQFGPGGKNDPGY